MHALQVKFFLNTDPSSDGSEPVYVATAAPFMMGATDDGEPQSWAFEAGEVSICAQVVPNTEDVEEVIVTETGTSIDGGAAEVCLVLGMFEGLPVVHCSFTFVGAVFKHASVYFRANCIVSSSSLVCSFLEDSFQLAVLS